MHVVVRQSVIYIVDTIPTHVVVCQSVMYIIDTVLHIYVAIT